MSTDQPLAYPLSWPAGWPRTKPADRRRARFTRGERIYSSVPGSSSYVRQRELSVHDATHRILAELARLGAGDRDIVVSTNIELRRDGLPRSDRRAPDDPGVAVYWREGSTREQQCMAIDLYDSVAGNLAAVAATIDAMRAIERHGGAQILKRAFQGFKALPASTTPALSTEAAAEVLARRMNGARGTHSIEQIVDMIVTDETWARDAVRAAAAKTHPDRGGRVEDFQLVQEAKRVLEAHHGGAL